MRPSLLALLLLSIACGGGANGQPDESPSPSTSGAEHEATPTPPPRRERLDDDAVAAARTQALSTHTMAGQAYTHCLESHEMGDCVRAQGLYGIAADTWASLLAGRADDADAPEWRFMHAQALFRADRFAEAAEAFERHLDEGVSGEWQAQAQWMLIVACEHLVDEAIERGDLARRTDPPAAAGQPPSVPSLNLPVPIARLQAARARYVEHVEAGQDFDDHLRHYALAHALTLYRYGHWTEAEPELTALFNAGCAGDAAWDGARTAWLALRGIATGRGRLDALADLGEALESQACSFGGVAADCAADPQHPVCLARADAARIRRVGGERFMQRAQHSQGEERTRWATRAGTTYLASLETQPAPSAFTRALALSHAAAAFVLAGDATRLADVDGQLMALNLDDFEGSEREFAVQELAHALVRRMQFARAASDHAAVARLAPRLLDPALDTPDLTLERNRARQLLAQSQAALGHHREAAAAYHQLADATQDADVRREASLQAALEERQVEGCRRGRDGLRHFAATYTGQASAREGVVRVLWELAACERQGSDAYFTALSSLLEAHSSTPGALTLETREHAAEATFRSADRDFDQVTHLRLRLPRVEEVEEFATRIPETIAEPAARVTELVQAYDAVEPLSSNEWSIAAASRSAAAVKALMDAIEHAEWELPTSVRRTLPQLGQTTASQIHQGTEARIHELLEQQAEHLRCRAAARFSHAANMAGDGMHTRYAEDARRGFAAIDADVLARCRQRDRSAFR